jgi:outer membrane protein assembly factor BamB
MIAFAFAAVALVLSAAADQAWPQWGGPRRDFAVDARALATNWPDGGPRRLWSRPLGPGFSAIVSDGATLYTSYRDGAHDVVVAIDAADGKIIWASRYEAPFHESCSQRLGPVPRAAPLVHGDRVVAVSAGGLMVSLERATGKLRWQHALVTGTSPRPCGYSASPVAYQNLLITTAGGKGQAVVAVDAAKGTRVWESQDFENGYSSPLLIDLDGRPEVIVFTYGEVSGLNPATGALEWTHPHPADLGVNVATPLYRDHLLFVSSAYNGGSRVLHLRRREGRVEVEEVWAHKRVRIHFGNAVRIGDRVMTSSGDAAIAPLVAVNVHTGDLVWRDRTLTRATLLAVGEKLIVLDEDGNLAIATPGAEALTIHSKAQVMTGRTWTVPTLVGTTLFIRSEQEIVALDLSPTASTSSR